MCKLSIFERLFDGDNLHFSTQTFGGAFKRQDAFSLATLKRGTNPWKRGRGE